MGRHQSGFLTVWLVFVIEFGGGGRGAASHNLRGGWTAEELLQVADSTLSRRREPVERQERGLDGSPRGCRPSGEPHLFADRGCERRVVPPQPDPPARRLRCREQPLAFVRPTPEPATPESW